MRIVYYMNTTGKVLTVSEAAEVLRYSEYTIRIWCQTGVLPAAKVGRKWRINSKAVTALLGRAA